MFNIKPYITGFFKPYFQIDAHGRFVFFYTHNTLEYWSPGIHKIPSTDSMWLVGDDCPQIITDLFIAYSAVDIICFVSQQPHHLVNYPEQKAFAALGLTPNAFQIRILKGMFPLARWHLLFSADLLGKIADAAIAIWYKNYSVTFRVNDSNLIARYRNQTLRFDVSKFSLHQFEKATGLRAGLRTHKPPPGSTSFVNFQNLPEHDT